MGFSDNRIIIDKGSTSWRIVLSSNASPSERHASQELQHFLKEISGVTVPIVEDSIDIVPHEILVGRSTHLEIMEPGIDWNRLGDEGFLIRTKGDYLIIAGGQLRGTLYGVYTFLEDYLGCRWFSSKVSRIPKSSRIEIGPIDDEQIPVLEYRDVFYYDAFDPDWCARNKCNGNTPELEEKHGGKVKYSHFVHTFDQLVPVSKYFETHPEYFSEVKGKRTDEKYVSQLCLSNPEVYQIALDKVKKWIADDPEASIVSVSQNDGGGGDIAGCECEKCRAIDEHEGSPSGSIIHFVNKIAEAIEKDYPNVAIDTLAYRYSRRPPKEVRPRDNVIVRLCSIECCFTHPFNACSVENDGSRKSSFAEDIKAWSKVCKRLYVWDYVTNFANYVMPFPNLRVLQPNIKFLVENNVKGIFEEGNYSKKGGGEFAELRAYLLAKLLWNPDYDVEWAMNEFLQGYYGQAAAPIREYIDMMHDKLEADNAHLGIYDPPTAPYFTREIIEKAAALFDRAELLAENEEILQRVRMARLPVMFVQIHQMDLEDPRREQMVEELFDELRKAGVTRIKETKTLEQSYEMVKQGIVRTF